MKTQLFSLIRQTPLTVTITTNLLHRCPSWAKECRTGDCRTKPQRNPASQAHGLPSSGGVRGSSPVKI